ncbi:MAG: DUF1428 domain-containing protein [Bacteroidetes bacterium]|nr:DUF1428 domain-containing protein [Bacteroidota bacterium]
MARYIDGFVIPVPRRNLARYKRMAALAGRVWLEHGALEYYEAVGEDLSPEGVAVPFPRLTKARAGETVVFSWIVYKSRKHRDQVNKKVMADPRLQPMMPERLKDPPMDLQRMTFGGFDMLVDMPPAARKKSARR